MHLSCRLSFGKQEEQHPEESDKTTSTSRNEGNYPFTNEKLTTNMKSSMKMLFTIIIITKQEEASNGIEEKGKRKNEIRSRKSHIIIFFFNFF